ncbi:3-oxoacyl-[acyl-carrier-protein] reductase [Lentibacillus sp. JNUCC-1]|nr:3-oxoacyl-[acyl-carrier-protein] reductase [Lentibacillus sp. JNUCC-1]
MGKGEKDIMKLNEQIVLVTGASRGLGAAIAKAFGHEGAKVVVNYLASEDLAEAVVQEIGADRAIALKADVRDQDAVKLMFAKAKDHFGSPVTTVVNNALIGFKFNGDLRKQINSIAWGTSKLNLKVVLKQH